MITEISRAKQHIQDIVTWLTNFFCFRFEYLTLYNGHSSASPQIGKYCGTSLPPNFISSTNRAYIYFHTREETSTSSPRQNHLEPSTSAFELEYDVISGKLVWLPTIMNLVVEYQVWMYKIWQYWLWSFKSGDTKLERFLSKNQHT